MNGQQAERARVQAMIQEMQEGYSAGETRFDTLQELLQGLYPQTYTLYRVEDNGEWKLATYASKADADEWSDKLNAEADAVRRQGHGYCSSRYEVRELHYQPDTQIW